MRNNLLIVFLLFISALCAQERKFGLEINQNMYVGNSLRSNETDFHFIYRINPQMNIKLGNVYVYNREDYLLNETNLSVGAGRQFPLKDNCGLSKLEVFSLMSIPYGYYSFDRYNIDLGVKLIYKKLIFMNFGFRFKYDEWLPVTYMQNRTASFGVFSGFGLTLDFEECSFRKNKRNKVNGSKN
jgi:hypothetical protein